MILDATCGAKQMWYQKDAKDVVYLDKRHGEIYFPPSNSEFWKQGNLFFDPTIIADNRQLPFKDNSFDMILFDPPFVVSMTPRMKAQYDILNPITWTIDIGKAANEFFRVLKQGGFLILKWGEGYAVVREALKLFPVKPLFGTHLNYSKHKTWWIVFRKD